MARLKCLRCGGVHSRRVVHGVPGPELIEAAERGELVLGGCDPTRPLRSWFCDECERTMPEAEREALLAAAEAAEIEAEEQ